MKRSLVGSLVLAVAVLAGCGSSGSSGSSSHSIFRVGTDVGIDSMNPFVGNNPDSNTVYMNIYSYLLQYGPQFQYEPDLATSWTQRDGGREWVFNLGSGFKWSNGTPVTASDVSSVINWATHTAGLGRVGEVFGTDFVGATAPDAHTVILKWTQPNGVILSELARWPVVNPQQWIHMNSKQAANYQNTSPIGSGPFEVVSYTRHQTLVAKRNPYWPGPKPKIAQFGLQQFSNDDAMISALRSGEIDAVEQVPAPDFRSLQADSGLTVTSTPSSFIDDFIINSNPNKHQHKELLNQTVRLAFADAINKNAIVQLGFDGQGKPTSNIVTPNYGNAPGTGRPWQDPNIPPDTYSPSMANQLLDGLGFKRGANGIRVADGHQMSYTMIVPTDAYPSVLRVADLLQGDLAAIGVKITLQTVDSAEAATLQIGTSATPATPKNSYLNWDLATWNWTAEPDPSTLLVVTTTMEYGDLSDTGYTNPAYDALYNQEIHTVNPNARLNLLWQMQKILATARPYIPLVNANELQAVSRSWSGLQYTPRGFFTELSKANLENVH
ncbi:MAG: peptide ABC transporter substrate-binding protein [Chloroflexi bacterium]|nr:peptide ABC transporter substrate-binding protein [Chloroflexota bacterium]